MEGAVLVFTLSGEGAIFPSQLGAQGSPYAGPPPSFHHFTEHPLRPALTAGCWETKLTLASAQPRRSLWSHRGQTVAESSQCFLPGAAAVTLTLPNCFAAVTSLRLAQFPQG